MIERSELHDAARQAFGGGDIKTPRDDAWKLASELGWLLIPVPEELGGLGLGRDSTAAIHYEMGRVLGTAPLTTALMTVTALAHAGALPNQAGWVERASGGELITTALLLKGPKLATAADGSTRLDGTLEGVCDADIATHVLVIAEGLQLCSLVPLDAAGVSTVERPLWDESRRVFDVTLNAVKVDPALVLATGDAVKPLSRLIKGEMLSAIAADSLGGAEAVLDMTVEYLKTRRQFDRPLAMFQALKHRCADLRTQITAATALLWSRSADADARIADLGALKALATDCYRMVAEEAIQLHGGIGLTDEHPAHLYLKRAMLNLQLGGSLEFWREAAGRAALKALAPA
jgi:alkylation response protein AidB-like acyl-CoA dehydrogenase